MKELKEPNLTRDNYFTVSEFSSIQHPGPSQRWALQDQPEVCLVWVHNAQRVFPQRPLQERARSGVAINAILLSHKDFISKILLLLFYPLIHSLFFLKMAWDNHLEYEAEKGFRIWNEI